MATERAPDAILGDVVPLDRADRLPDRVARELLDRILAGALQQGQKLPSERDLGEQFGVSRTVIREAVRSLAAKGVVDVRSGSGVRVAAVDAGAVRELMSLYFRGQPAVDYAKIAEVRRALELTTARVAAERADPGDLKHLRADVDRLAAALDDQAAASRADVAFHMSVARATQNELFPMLLDSIGEILLEVRLLALSNRRRVREALEHHRNILARIEAGDAPGAESAMQAHLVDAERLWRSARR